MLIFSQLIWFNLKNIFLKANFNKEQQLKKNPKITRVIF